MRWGAGTLAAAAAVCPLAAQAPALDWRSAPVAAGGWSYVRGAGFTEARFASAVAIRCDLATRRVRLSVASPWAGSTMRVDTTTIARSVPLDGAGSAELGATDPLLDAIAFSRGRFAISAEGVGAARWILPSWPEPARAVEDCRK